MTHNYGRVNCCGEVSAFQVTPLCGRVEECGLVFGWVDWYAGVWVDGWICVWAGGQADGQAGLFVRGRAGVCALMEWWADVCRWVYDQ